MMKRILLSIAILMMVHAGYAQLEKGYRYGTATFSRGSSYNPPADTGGTGGGGGGAIDSIDIPSYSQTGKHVTVAGGGTGTYASPWSIAQANANLVAGDSCYIHPGTYTTQLNLANGGTVGSRITIKNWGVGVCSLRVVGSTVVNLTQNYVTIQGLSFDLPAYEPYRVLYFNGVTDCALIRCRIYGASCLTDGNFYGNWISAEFSNCVDVRVMRCYLDRRDANITRDNDRGQGYEVNGTSTRRVIFEQDTATNVSHYAFSMPQGTGASDCFVIMRNCIAYNNHCGGGNNGTNNRYLFEGNRFFRTGMINTYKDGQSIEIIGSKGIIRYNNFYEDGPAAAALLGETVNNLFLSDLNNRTVGNMIYNNNFMGNSLNNKLVHAATAYNAMNDTQFGQNWVNNFIGYPNSYAGVTAYFWQNQMSGFQAMDTMNNNCLWTHAPGDNVAWLNNGGNFKYTLAQMKSTFPTLWNSGNIETVPGWVDSTTQGINRNFTLAPSSRLVEAGGHLTTVASAVSASTIVNVGNAAYFHYDWGKYDKGDSLYFSNGTLALLDSVDYNNNRLILTSAATIPAGTGVSILSTFRAVTQSYVRRLYGTLPDIGSYEKP